MPLDTWTIRSEAMSTTSRTLLTELQVDNSTGRIRIGSYAQVRFASITAAPALTLPASALLFRAQGLQVGVVNAQGLVELRKIELGRDFGVTLGAALRPTILDRDVTVLNPARSRRCATKAVVHD